MHFAHLTCTSTCIFKLNDDRRDHSTWEWRLDQLDVDAPLFPIHPSQAEIISKFSPIAQTAIAKSEKAKSSKAKSDKAKSGKRGMANAQGDWYYTREPQLQEAMFYSDAAQPTRSPTYSDAVQPTRSPTGCKAKSSKAKSDKAKSGKPTIRVRLS